MLAAGFSNASADPEVEFSAGGGDKSSALCEHASVAAHAVRKHDPNLYDLVIA
jgi:hypothetical protein